MGAEGKSRKLPNLLRRALGEFRMRVQTRTHRGSTDGQVVESVERKLQAFDVALQQAGPATELLSKSQGHGILQVGASDLHHIAEFLGLGRDRVVHGLDRWNQRVLYPLRGCDMHCGGESIIR